MKWFEKMLAAILSAICLSASAQRFSIGLHGEVTDYFSGEPLKGAKVAVYGQGWSDSLLTRADGIYAFELQEGQFYRLEASRPDRVHKVISIDADSVPSYPDVPFYDMDIQITLFEPIPGFDFGLFDHPIGLAEYKHSIRNMSFDNEYTENISKLFLRPTMDEYEKAWAGYFERKSVRTGEDVTPAIPDARVMVDSSSRPDWTRPTRLIIEDSILSSSADTIEFWEEPEEEVLSVPVDSIDGLFFTVQVGVYTRGVSLMFEEQVPDIRPLNSEEIDGGNHVRFTTGRFASLGEAQLRADQCKRMGVPDAFVTAYFEGIRISVKDALDALRVHGKSIISGDIDRE
jgi:hypothetical protein